jgi:hypothetical protein
VLAAPRVQRLRLHALLLVLQPNGKAKQRDILTWREGGRVSIIIYSRDYQLCKVLPKIIILVFLLAKVQREISVNITPA